MSRSTPVCPILAVGCGNPDAGEDGFGLRVTQALAARPCPGLEVVALGTRPADLLDVLSDRTGLLVIDAARRPDGSSGQFFDLDWYGPARRRLVFAAPLSSHGRTIADFLVLAETLELLPARVQLLGATIAHAEPGAGLGESCERLVMDVVRAVQRHTRRWLASSAPETC
ncbi:MAG: hydrogenase maturation protease [bacterium]